MVKQILAFILGFLTIAGEAQIATESKNNMCLLNADYFKTSSYTPIPNLNVFNVVFKNVGENSDAYPDAVYLDMASTSLKIARNTGSIAASQFFSMSVNVATKPSFFYGNVAVADYNFDGKSDIVNGTGLNNIYIHTQNAVPYSFSLDSISNVTPTTTHKTKVYNFNYNNDSKTDVLVGSSSNVSPNGYFFNVLQNNSNQGGPVTFSPTISTSSVLATMTNSAGAKFEIAVADIMGDTRDEFIFVSPEIGENIGFGHWLFGNLTYSLFSVPVNGSNIYKNVKVLDLNNDSQKEIAVLGELSGISYVYICSPAYTSSFVTGISIDKTIVLGSLGVSADDISFGDINRDGWLDLIVSRFSNNTIEVYRGGRNANLDFESTPTLFKIPNHQNYYLTVADVDQNLKPDIISYSPNSGSTIGLLRNFTVKDTMFSENLKYKICPGDSLVLVHQMQECQGCVVSGYATSFFSASAPKYIHKKPIYSSGTYTTNVVYPTLFSSPPSITTCSLISSPVVISPAVVPTISTSGNKLLCQGDSTTLNAIGASSLIWSFNQANTSSVIVKPPATVAYTVSGLSMDGCKGFHIDTVKVVPDFTPSINSSKSELCKDEKARVSATGGVSYYWLNGATSSTIDYFQINGRDSVLSVEVTNAAGCKRTGTIEILFNDECKELVVFTGITPNSDGLNDHLHIQNIESYPKNNVKIFNRWGATLFNQEGYDNQKVVWPTQNENTILTSGTYYYVINPGDGSQLIKGWIELLK
ncbi:MAG: gliding motility-associated C-terminal domain-containing protein [Bacteroidia bacterium]